MDKKETKTRKPYHKKYYEEHKEDRKQYRKDTKEYHKKWMHDYYLRNKESLNEQHQKYRDDNVEKEKTRHALYRANNPNKNKEYYQNNVERLKANSKEHRKKNKKYYKKYNKKYQETHKDEIFVRRRQYRKDNAEAIRIKKYDRHRGSKTDLVLNNYFENSNLHHIEEGIGIYVPVELHLSVHYVLKSGEGMWKINRKVFEWIVETGQKVLMPVKTA